VAQICHRLDGIPLAIELAAAKVRVLGVEQIAKRLDDRFRLLTGGSRTALERHQTLRAAIDWSYNLLPTAEQVLFRRLSVFVGGWTSEAAESICGDGFEVDVFELLEQLINKSLVMMEAAEGQTRYHMLETMRQYAGEKLLEAGESDLLRDRHLVHFLDLAETAEPYLIRPEQLEWLARLDVDYENLRLAFEWALSKESAEPSLRLCGALAFYWILRNYWLEGTKWLDEALTKPARPSNTGDYFRAKALYSDAILSEILDDLPRLQESAEQSLKLAQGVADRREIAIARYTLGMSFWRQNDPDRALTLIEQSFIDSQEMNDPYWKMISYKIFSALLLRQGKMTQKEKYEHSFELARAAGERVELAGALLDLGFYHYMIEQFDLARKFAAEASELSKQIGSHLNEPNTLLSEIAWVIGDYKTAKSLMMEIQVRHGLLGEKNIRSALIGFLGSILLEEGDFGQARILLEDSLATALELQNTYFIVVQLIELGNLSYLERDLNEFKRKYRESTYVAKNLIAAEKYSCLFYTLRPLTSQAAQYTVFILGGLHRWQRETEFLVDPILNRFYDRAEAFTRQVLGNDGFETAFAEGQKCSLEEALDLVLKMVEEM